MKYRKIRPPRPKNEPVQFDTYIAKMASPRLEWRRSDPQQLHSLNEKPLHFRWNHITRGWVVPVHARVACAFSIMITSGLDSCVKVFTKACKKYAKNKANVLMKTPEVVWRFYCTKLEHYERQNHSNHEHQTSGDVRGTRWLGVVVVNFPFFHFSPR